MTAFADELVAAFSLHFSSIFFFLSIRILFFFNKSCYVCYKKSWFKSFCPSFPVSNFLSFSSSGKSWIPYVMGTFLAEIEADFSSFTFFFTFLSSSSSSISFLKLLISCLNSCSSWSLSSISYSSWSSNIFACLPLMVQQ